jgi:hypothetical protein
MVGAIIRHGPHHAAQRSSSTGNFEDATVAEKLASVTMIGVVDTAESSAPHLPQTGVLVVAAALETRFFVPHFGHATIVLWAGCAIFVC